MQVRHPMQAPVLILSAPLSIQLPYDGWPGRAAEGSSSPWAPVPHGNPQEAPDSCFRANSVASHCSHFGSKPEGGKPLSLPFFL